MNDNSKSSGNLPLRVDFITSEQFPQLQKLGILTVSGQSDWERDLEEGLDQLEDVYGESTLVVMDVNNALTASQVKDLEWQCLIRFPYIFCSLECAAAPSSLKKFAMCISEIVASLNNNEDDEKTIIYSVGSPSISGLTAACTIAVASEGEIDSARAIEMVRAARRDAVEPGEQERFVSLFGEYWKIYHKNLLAFYRQKQAVTEEVLAFGWFGDGVGIYRYETPAGKWNFYRVSLSIFPGAKGGKIAFDYDPDKIPFWEMELFGSVTEVLDSLGLKAEIPAAHPAFIHPEYRAEVKEYLENLYANLTDEQRKRLLEPGGTFAKTPEEWLAREDVFIKHRATFDDDQNEARENSAEFTTEPPAVSQQLSDRHFLIYWQERNVVAHEKSSCPLDVVSSRQLKRAKAGDTLWLVTINQAGLLVLAGRLKIGEIVDYKTAVERLNDSSLWDGGFYALPREDKAEYLRPTNLGEAALDLRFANTGSDRFVLKNGAINPQQMQSMRELTEYSAEMLARIWETGEENDDDFVVNLHPVEFMRQLVRDHPLAAHAHYKLAIQCDEYDLPEEANAAYRRAIELQPNFFDAYNNLGRNYLRAGELDKAEQVFKAAIRLYPKSAEDRFMLGLVYAEMRDYEKAIAVTKEGLKYDPDDPTAYFNLGNFYFHLQNYEKAVHWLEKSAEIDESVDPQTFYWLGKCYRHLGEKQKEFDAYRKAIEIEPDFLDARFALGTVYAHLTETAEGERVTYFETGGGKLEIKYARLFYYYMGLASLALGNLDKARERQAALRETDEPLADQLQFFINRFEVEFPQDGRKDEGNNWAELLENLRQIVREEPHNADAHYNFGVACDENDLPEEANAAYQKAIELDLSYWQAHYNLGQNYLRRSEFNKAEDAFITAALLNHGFAEAHFMLGVVYAAQNKHHDSIAATMRGLELSPDDAKAHFNIGNSYFHLRDYEKAAEWFEKSVEIEPNAPDTFYMLGKCYRELNEKKMEFDAYLQAVELTPDFVDALFALGTVYAHLTETEESVQVTYFETCGELILSDPRISFYLGLGNLALGNVDIAQDSQDDLRKMDERIADQLQFFIDRFDSENKNADDIFIDNIFIDNIPNSAELLKEKRKSFKVKVGETIIEAQNTPELYRQVMTLLFDRGLLQDSHVPFATSSTRYLIAKEPVHPSGKNFFKFVEHAGFYMETNKSRHDAVSHLKKFVETLQVEFENLEDGIPIRVTPPVKKQNTQPTVEQRFLGSLLGLAVSDALGTTVEFKPTGTFPRVTTITGGGPFGLNTGEWTDDTSMALCLADSLIESAGFDLVDQMRRYCRWKNEGYLSSNGTTFDIGMTVRRALEKFEREQTSSESTPFCGSVSPSTAGNGSLMRLAPVPLFFANDAKKAIDYAAESSRTTHGARECIDACRYLAALIVGAVQGKSKEELLSAKFTPLPGLWEAEPLTLKVAEIAEGSFKAVEPPQIIGSIQGYVIISLHVALWAFYHTDNFADGALKAVNLGYDADTYGAIYGQLAGAYYGVQSIPEDWLSVIAKRDLIESFAEKLYIASTTK